MRSLLALVGVLFALPALAQTPQRTGPLSIQNSLSEIAGNGPTAQAAARGNLGLGTAATQPGTAFDAAGVSAAETTRATAAEAVNAASVVSETTRALIAEGLTATAVTTETARARAAEGANATAIAGETTRATGAETTLTTGVGANAAAITSEATTARTNEATNASAIAAETTNRGTAVTGEATARASGDATNATAIASEATTRAAAVTAESTARLSGDATNATAIAAAQATANAALPTASAGPLATQAGATPSAAIQNALGFAPYSSANPSGYVTASGAASAAPVQSVAGRTGAITLSNTDIAGFATAASAASPVQSVAGRGGNVVLGVGDVSGAATAASVTAETSRATGAETTLTTGVSSNSTAIATETTRATGAESTLTTAAAAAQTTANAALPKAGGTMTGALHLGTQTIDGSAVGFTGGTESGLTVGANIATPTGANTALTLSALAAQQGVLLDSFKVAGDADDTASMTRAVAAGVCVLLGPKTYSINNYSMAGTPASFCLKGIQGQSIIQRTSATGSQFFRISAANVLIDGVTFDMNKTALPSASQWGVFMGTGGQNVTVRNSGFKNNNGTLGYGMALISTGPAAGGAFDVSGNEFSGNTTGGLWLGSVTSGVARANYAHDNTGPGITAGAYLTATSTNYLSAVLIAENRLMRNGYGVAVGGYGPPYAMTIPPAVDVVVQGNIFQDNSTYSIQLQGLRLSALGNDISQSAPSVVVFGGIVGPGQSILVADNTVNLANTPWGIDIGGSTEGVVRGNIVTMNTGDAINTGANPNGLVTTNKVILSGTATGVSIAAVETDGNGSPMPNLSSGIVVENNSFSMSGSGTVGVRLFDNACGMPGNTPCAVRYNRFTGSSITPYQDIEWLGLGTAIQIDGNLHNNANSAFSDPTANLDMIFDLVYLGGSISGTSSTSNIRSFITRDFGTYGNGNNVLWVQPVSGGTGYVQATTTITVTGSGGGSGWTGFPLVIGGVIIGVRTLSPGSYTGTITATATDTSGGTGATFSVGTTPRIPYFSRLTFIPNVATQYVQKAGGFTAISYPAGFYLSNVGGNLVLQSNSSGSLWNVVSYELPTFAIGSLPTCGSTQNGTLINVSGSVSNKWQARCNATNWIAPDGTTIN